MKENRKKKVVKEIYKDSVCVYIYICVSIFDILAQTMNIYFGLSYKVMLMKLYLRTGEA